MSDMARPGRDGDVGPSPAVRRFEQRRVQVAGLASAPRQAQRRSAENNNAQCSRRCNWPSAFMTQPKAEGSTGCMVQVAGGRWDRTVCGRPATCNLQPATCNAEDLRRPRGFFGIALQRGRTRSAAPGSSLFRPTAPLSLFVIFAFFAAIQLRRSGSTAPLPPPAAGVTAGFLL